MKQTRSLSEFSRPTEFTRLYPRCSFHRCQLPRDFSHVVIFCLFVICHIIFGLPGPCVPITCISHAGLTAGLECSICSYQRSISSSGKGHQAQVLQVVSYPLMPKTLKKSKGHIALGLSVLASVCYKFKTGFCNFIDGLGINILKSKLSPFVELRSF